MLTSGESVSVMQSRGRTRRLLPSNGRGTRTCYRWSSRMGASTNRSRTTDSYSLPRNNAKFFISAMVIWAVAGVVIALTTQHSLGAGFIAVFCSRRCSRRRVRRQLYGFDAEKRHDHLLRIRQPTSRALLTDYSQLPRMDSSPELRKEIV